jgi:hypothetical protein
MSQQTFPQAVWPKCRCTHPRGEHLQDGTGPCKNAWCKCRTYRDWAVRAVTAWLSHWTLVMQPATAPQVRALVRFVGRAPTRIYIERDPEHEQARYVCEWVRGE